jgi:hypothetical protein
MTLKMTARERKLMQGNNCKHCADFIGGGKAAMHFHLSYCRDNPKNAHLYKKSLMRKLLQILF